MTVSRTETLSATTGPGFIHQTSTEPEAARGALNSLAGYERFGPGDEDAIREAIRSFQASAGLPETGRVDEATKDALTREAARIEASRDAAESLNLPAEVREEPHLEVGMHPLLACNLWEQLRERAEGVVDGARDLASDAIEEAERAVVGLDEVGRGDMPSVASASRTFADTDDARHAFAHQVTRLFDVNSWDTLSGMENASFALFDAGGNPVERTVAREGDFVRIDLPGPGGYDWVRIESGELSDDRAAITVRPSHDPTADPIDESATAHFFTSEATNEFSVARNGTTVTARVEGRNEHANTGEEARDRVSAARNRAVAEGAWGAQMDVPGAGRVNGMQQHQWDRFTENLSALD